MCQKKPGPRCSAHGRHRLEAAAARLQELEEAGVDGPSRQQALQRHRDAQRDFDSTPAGQRDLQQRLEHGDVEGTAAEREHLRQRLAEGRQRRAAARAAAAEVTQPESSSTLTTSTESPSGTTSSTASSTTDTREQGNDRDRTHQPAAPSRGQSPDAGGARGVPAAAGLAPGAAPGAAGDDRGAVVGRGDRGGAPDRLLIDGRSVQPIAVHQPPEDLAARLRAQGKSTPTLHELAPADAGAYRDSIAALASSTPYAASVYVYSEQEYAQMRLLVTDDGRSGVALKGDEIVSVFSRADGEHRGCAESMLATAVAAGGRRLDCFDTVLPRVYSAAGFVPTARLRWNDEYAPDGWSYETYSAYNGGRPDVVFMAYDPDHVGGRYDPTGGIHIDDYDDGVSAAQAAAKEPRST